MEGMVGFRTDRLTGTKKGGVTTYVKENLASLTEVALSNSTDFVEILALVIKPLHLVLVNIYRPPACPTPDFNNTINILESQLNNMSAPLPRIVITGVFNLPHVDWQRRIIPGGSREDHTQAELLFTLADSWCLNHYITTPTRGKHMLDLFWSNNDELVHDQSLEDTLM
ncbi:hypothetical protein Pmani_025469 [Petrolisthes manimaculis]|uniref:Endonuclease/exonuclease/phosphatase domain-containing protein n=1 Tax=Petrolisthes manimaculis TaxID=1843537 RepID=A0AAE1TYD8_9EUCA|nr:hypothetical protein Pmani_025469 [Petrolisthes manimaculis]